MCYNTGRWARFRRVSGRDLIVRSRIGGGKCPTHLIRYSAAGALLLQLKAQTQAIVAEIRRLVYDLRPPALDHLGLIAAVREYAASQKELDDLLR